MLRATEEPVGCHSNTETKNTRREPGKRTIGSVAVGAGGAVGALGVALLLALDAAEAGSASLRTRLAT